ncbi:MULTISPECIES: ANTAR domain-containing response regulator [unclassified Pantoea]|uniref:ANTAR domain-containing response regulator n=1 Tax=unclassified Pantoea TaxID=2630326 RepID=UPI001CD47F7F|nr:MULTISPECIES: ANTAR domain-containing protein [unclassified Pantoea]MCA1177238.1 ANTAR domain-containing protein [Pantoea sp. alder69]MCA1253572.1 ANTAR domain-containing protein [Pantoea sp. alder70]MCA1265727.1 ANTAR domain-containing protein [Pantoea sp. alder81]
MNEPSLLKTLAGVQLHIFHPDSQSVRAFCASLTQIGCHAQHSWPPVAECPADAQLLLVAIENHHEALLTPLFHSLQQHHTPVIALANCHDARLFPLLMKLQPTAIAERELNPFALIVQIIGSWQSARQNAQLRGQLQARQQRKPKSERLAQAKGVLMQTFGLDESGAYRFMRTEAMNTRSSLEFTAERVISQLQKG